MPALEDHPLAAIFPLMAEPDLTALADDIEANGLREPLWLYEGKILDGRNRYRACVLKDIDQRVEHYRGKDPLGFVISKNLHRRHLTESQRALVAAKIAKAGRGRPAENGGNSPHLTNAEAASLLNVSVDSVKSAKTVQSEGVPELATAVEAGRVSVSAAAEVAKLPKAEQEKVVAAGPAAVKSAAKNRKSKNKKPASSPPKADDGKADSTTTSGGEQPQTRAGVDPFALPGKAADPEDPPLDPRFMPHAEAAAALAEKFRNWKARLLSVRTELRKEFPDRDAVMARRIDARGQFDASLGELIDTLDRNVPAHACPCCCGTGDDSGPCKYCDGYGVVDAHHHAGLKARWKRTAGRLAELAAAAGGEVA